jgi:hypothetical protein
MWSCLALKCHVQGLAGIGESSTFVEQSSLELALSLLSVKSCCTDLLAVVKSGQCMICVKLRNIIQIQF